MLTTEKMNVEKHFPLKSIDVFGWNMLHLMDAFSEGNGNSSKSLSLMFGTDRGRELAFSSISLDNNLFETCFLNAK
jgi:hypothetical protein